MNAPVTKAPTKAPKKAAVPNCANPRWSDSDETLPVMLAVKKPVAWKPAALRDPAIAASREAKRMSIPRVRRSPSLTSIATHLPADPFQTIPTVDHHRA
jgi:hypothetical protein